MTRGYKDEEKPSEPFVVSEEACIVVSTEFAVKVSLGRHEHEAITDAEVWMPKAAIHPDSEVHDHRDASRARLVVHQWFARAKKWDSSDETPVPKQRLWFGVKLQER